MIGPNHAFVNQSGTFPKAFSDFDEDTTARMHAKEEAMVCEALVSDCGVEATPEAMSMFRILTG